MLCLNFGVPYRMYPVTDWATKSDIRKGVPSYYPPNTNRMWLKLTKISRSEDGGFSIFCEKCHVGDVTSGFRFPVGHDLNRSTCSCECLVVTYFRCERCSKVRNKVYDLSFLQSSDGLSWSRSVFLYCQKQQEVGKEAVNCPTFPPKSQLL